MIDEVQQPDDLPVDKLTWSVLLARWVEFARAAVALPTEGEGAKMRSSIADVIMLQAVWFSLGNLESLDPDQLALGLDRAQVLIDKHAGVLESRWGDDMSEAMRELIDDARDQLAAAKSKPRPADAPAAQE